MARLNFSVSVSNAAVPANTTKSVMVHALAAGIRLALLGYGASFRGRWGNDEPGLVDLGHGTIQAGSPLARVKLDDGIAEVPSGFARHSILSEPSIVHIWKQNAVHPQSSFYLADDREKQAIISQVGGATARCYFRCRFSEAQEVSAFMEFEE